MYMLLHDPCVCVRICSCTVKRQSRAGYGKVPKIHRDILNLLITIIILDLTRIRIISIGGIGETLHKSGHTIPVGTGQDTASHKIYSTISYRVIKERTNRCRNNIDMH